MRTRKGIGRMIGSLRTFGVAGGAFAALSFSGSVPAQSGQTPENAQRFLKTAIDQGSVEAQVDDLAVTRIMDSGWNCGPAHSYSCDTTASRLGVVTWVTDDSRCTSEIKATFNSYTDSHATVFVKENPFKARLDWAKIAGVSADGKWLKFAGAGRLASLYFATPDLAKRAEKAINFLIQSCDPLKETGF